MWEAGCSGLCGVGPTLEWQKDSWVLIARATPGTTTAPASYHIYRVSQRKGTNRILLEPYGAQGQAQSLEAGTPCVWTLFLVVSYED